MIGRHKSVVVAFIGLFLFSAAAHAAGDDVFVVPRVAVQAQAASATSAKAQAQSYGRRRAMDILLRRLTVEDDWIYLPKFTTNEPSPAGLGQGVPPLDESALQNLESSFEVYEEKTSSSTYRAYITYRFKPAAVRRLLRDASIPYSEAQTRTALVLPVLETSSGLYLWEENSPWMAAWKVRPYNNELTPMSAPLGDLEDAAAVSARQALAIDQDALTALADRYSVSQVIIAHAYLRQDDGEDTLRVRLINGIRESGSVDEPLEFFTDATGVAAAAPPQSDTRVARAGEVLAEEWFKRPSGNFPTLAEEAIEVVIAKYAKPWKEQTLIDHSEATILEASAYFQSLGEWTKIRSALISTPLIASVQVRSLSRNGAEMIVRAFGDPEKLIVTMESQGLAMWPNDDDVWTIATPTTAQTIRYRERDSRSSRRSRFGSVSDIIEDSESGDGITPAAATLESDY